MDDDDDGDDNDDNGSRIGLDVAWLERRNRCHQESRKKQPPGYVCASMVPSNQ